MTISLLSLLAAALVGAVNPTPSPDSTLTAYTDSCHNLFVSGPDGVRAITSDGSDVILNGYASWVCYEEILGRSSHYRAFWWSPDSRKVAFYRFDNSRVPVFPIYSPEGQDGSLNLTRYPKAGETNPSVSLWIADLGTGRTVRASLEGEYFGIPFWGEDSRFFYVPVEPRVQNTLELYRIGAEDGAAQRIYSEHYPTWVEWPGSMLFSDRGLYMVRSFETGWEQIYFLSYDGRTLKRLTDGTNTFTKLVALGGGGTVYFTSRRDSDVRTMLYSLGRGGRVKRISPWEYNVSDVRFSDDFSTYEATLSNLSTPGRVCVCSARTGEILSCGEDLRPDDFREEECKHLIYLDIDGMKVPGAVLYPEGFDSTKRYPAIMEIYGGPSTCYVSDAWSGRMKPHGTERWCRGAGIVKFVVDARVAGHNGRAGTDLSHLDVVSVPVHDFCRWAEYIGSLPFIDSSRIGVEGFSFGGTMTAMLVMTRPDLFRCGVAGGGVYDWTLYDTHYTERFMDTPRRNPEGYARARTLDRAGQYDDTRSRLKLTHGTGDDNVHFQNTLQMVDALQRKGKKFDLMIYPDGMHGYSGTAKAHDEASDHEFWTRYLLQL